MAGLGRGSFRPGRWYDADATGRTRGTRFPRRGGRALLTASGSTRRWLTWAFSRRLRRGCGERRRHWGQGGTRRPGSGLSVRTAPANCFGSAPRSWYGAEWRLRKWHGQARGPRPSSARTAVESNGFFVRNGLVQIARSREEQRRGCTHDGSRRTIRVRARVSPSRLSVAIRIARNASHEFSGMSGMNHREGVRPDKDQADQPHRVTPCARWQIRKPVPSSRAATPWLRLSSDYPHRF